MSLDIGPEAAAFAGAGLHVQHEQTDAELSLEGHLARALELVNESVVSYDPLIREEYDTRGRKLPSGALVVRCVIEGPEGFREDEVTIDEKRRPLSELTITMLGAVANEQLSQAKTPAELLPKRGPSRGNYIHRVVC